MYCWVGVGSHELFLFYTHYIYIYVAHDTELYYWCGIIYIYYLYIYIIYIFIYILYTHTHIKISWKVHGLTKVYVWVDALVGGLDDIHMYQNITASWTCVVFWYTYMSFGLPTDVSAYICVLVSL